MLSDLRIYIYIENKSTKQQLTIDGDFQVLQDFVLSGILGGPTPVAGDGACWYCTQAANPNNHSVMACPFHQTPRA